MLRGDLEKAEALRSTLTQALGDPGVHAFPVLELDTGAVEKAQLPSYSTDGAGLPAPRERRPVLFDNVEKPVDTPVFDRMDLPAGTRFEGPAVIDQFDSTTVVPPDVAVEIDEWLNIRMTLPST